MRQRKTILSRLPRMTPISVAVIVLSGAGPDAGQFQGGTWSTSTTSTTSGGPPSDIVAAFLDRQDPPVRSYRARRRLEARNERLSKHGWIDVITELTPSGFTYQVIAEGGSDAARKKVLYPALDGERDAVRNGAAGAFTPSNYRLAADGFEGPLARIRLTPTRKDTFLVDGWLLISPHDADLVAVRGHLVKPPSFWTTRVDLVRRYQRIAGVRVPVELESIASVRLLGQSTFRMTYTYERVNGVVVAR